ncbi:MAG: hypothetical protein Q4B42_06305, partial [Oscillospiraceae bacterium]|nr:hypothetical protein [Oscillospiraceae bacterium]
MLRYTLSSLGLPAARGEEELVSRVWDMALSPAEYSALSERGKAISASERFKDVLKTFPTESG